MCAFYDAWAIGFPCNSSEDREEVSIMPDPKDPNLTGEDYTDLDIEGEKGGLASQDETIGIEDVDVTETPEIGSTDDQSEPKSRTDD
jgi:hypothetical protein